MLFSELDKKQIQEAVADLEKDTSGELVPYYVLKSDPYKEASWLLAFLFGAVITCLNFVSAYYHVYNEMMLLGSILLAFVLGWCLPKLFPQVVAMVMPDALMDLRVKRRAMNAFLEEEVFDTKERIGILIFISELEHEVVVLADKGINKVVGNEQWTDAVRLIVEGMKTDDHGQGVVKAIALCKKVLLENGFVRTEPSTANELGDHLREGY